ncbi:ANR family transcriptional regulator [Salmonella enterica]|nr:ANR family transcriptional regulator [Salmonella enterica]
MAPGIDEYAAKNQYGAYATGAGRAERNGEYGKAAELWRRAAASPCTALRRQWAQARAEFCENAHTKGWRPRDECERV